MRWGLEGSTGPHRAKVNRLPGLRGAWASALRTPHPKETRLAVERHGDWRLGVR